MNIKILAVGKLKEKYLSEAMAEYLKRLERFAKVEVLEVADRRIPDNASDKQCEQVLAQEGEKILAKIGTGDHVIALCVEAKQHSSVEFAQYLSDCALRGKSDIVFVIGGSLGLSDAVKQRADLRLGISKMTFPHQLMRVLLTEQIYRAFKIINRETYHK